MINDPSFNSNTLFPKRNATLKSNRLRPRYYPYTPPDYRHTHNSLWGNAENEGHHYVSGWINGLAMRAQTNGRMDATKCIISLTSWSIIKKITEWDFTYFVKIMERCALRLLGILSYIFSMGSFACYPQEHFPWWTWPGVTDPGFWQGHHKKSGH